MTETIVKKFRSPLEFLEWATNEPTPWTGSLSSREEGNSSWAGTNTYDEAYKLARFGWQEGLDRLAEQVEIAAQLSPQPQKPRNRYDIAGEFPDVARAAAGDPFSMISRGKAFKQKPIVNIRVNFGFLANEDSEKIMRWGAAICSYIQNLEKSGFSTQLDAFNEVRSSKGPSISFQFPLKKAGQPLSLSNIAFWWGHPASNRRICFSGRERLDVEQWYSSGYGSTALVTEARKGQLLLTIDDAGDSMEECLSVINLKHRDLLKNNPDSNLSMFVEKPNNPSGMR